MEHASSLGRRSDHALTQTQATGSSSSSPAPQKVSPPQPSQSSRHSPDDRARNHYDVEHMLCCHCDAQPSRSARPTVGPVPSASESSTGGARGSLSPRWKPDATTHSTISAAIRSRPVSLDVSLLEMRASEPRPLTVRRLSEETAPRVPAQSASVVAEACTHDGASTLPLTTLCAADATVTDLRTPSSQLTSSAAEELPASKNTAAVIAHRLAQCGRRVRRLRAAHVPPGETLALVRRHELWARVVREGLIDKAYWLLRHTSIACELLTAVQFLSELMRTFSLRLCPDAVSPSAETSVAWLAQSLGASILMCTSEGLTVTGTCSVISPHSCASAGAPAAERRLHRSVPSPHDRGIAARGLARPLSSSSLRQSPLLTSPPPPPPPSSSPPVPRVRWAPWLTRLVACAVGVFDQEVTEASGTRPSISALAHYVLFPSDDGSSAGPALAEYQPFLTTFARCCGPSSCTASALVSPSHGRLGAASDLPVQHPTECLLLSTVASEARRTLAVLMSTTSLMRLAQGSDTARADYDGLALRALAHPRAAPLRLLLLQKVQALVELDALSVLGLHHMDNDDDDDEVEVETEKVKVPCTLTASEAMRRRLVRTIQSVVEGQNSALMSALQHVRGVLRQPSSNHKEADMTEAVAPLRLMLRECLRDTHVLPSLWHFSSPLSSLPSARPGDVVSAVTTAEHALHTAIVTLSTTVLHALCLTRVWAVVEESPNITSTTTTTKPAVSTSASSSPVPAPVDNRDEGDRLTDAADLVLSQLQAYMAKDVEAVGSFLRFLPSLQAGDSAPVRGEDRGTGAAQGATSARAPPTHTRTPHAQRGSLTVSPTRHRAPLPDPARTLADAPPLPRWIDTPVLASHPPPARARYAHLRHGRRATRREGPHVDPNHGPPSPWRHAASAGCPENADGDTLSSHDHDHDDDDDDEDEDEEAPSLSGQVAMWMSSPAVSRAPLSASSLLPPPPARRHAQSHSLLPFDAHSRHTSASSSGSQGSRASSTESLQRVLVSMRHGVLLSRAVWAPPYLEGEATNIAHSASRVSSSLREMFPSSPPQSSPSFSLLYDHTNYSSNWSESPRPLVLPPPAILNPDGDSQSSVPSAMQPTSCVEVESTTPQPLGDPHSASTAPPAVTTTPPPRATAPLPWQHALHQLTTITEMLSCLIDDLLLSHEVNGTDGARGVAAQVLRWLIREHRPASSPSWSTLLWEVQRQLNARANAPVDDVVQGSLHTARQHLAQLAEATTPPASLSDTSPSAVAPTSLLPLPSVSSRAVTAAEVPGTLEDLSLQLAAVEAHWLHLVWRLARHDPSLAFAGLFVPAAATPQAMTAQGHATSPVRLSSAQRCQALWGTTAELTTTYGLSLTSAHEEARRRHRHHHKSPRHSRRPERRQEGRRPSSSCSEALSTPYEHLGDAASPSSPILTRKFTHRHPLAPAAFIGQRIIEVLQTLVAVQEEQAETLAVPGTPPMPSSSASSQVSSSPTPLPAREPTFALSDTQLSVLCDVVVVEDNTHTPAPLPRWVLRALLHPGTIYCPPACTFCTPLWNWPPPALRRVLGDVLITGASFQDNELSALTPPGRYRARCPDSSARPSRPRSLLPYMFGSPDRSPAHRGAGAGAGESETDAEWYDGHTRSHCSQSTRSSSMSSSSSSRDEDMAQLCAVEREEAAVVTLQVESLQALRPPARCPRTGLLVSPAEPHAVTDERTPAATSTRSDAVLSRPRRPPWLTPRTSTTASSDVTHLFPPRTEKQNDLEFLASELGILDFVKTLLSCTREVVPSPLLAAGAGAASQPSQSTVTHPLFALFNQATRLLAMLSPDRADAERRAVTVAAAPTAEVGHTEDAGNGNDGDDMDSAHTVVALFTSPGRMSASASHTPQPDTVLSSADASDGPPPHREAVGGQGLFIITPPSDGVQTTSAHDDAVDDEDAASELSVDELGDPVPLTELEASAIWLSAADLPDELPLVMRTDTTIMVVLPPPDARCASSPHEVLSEDQCSDASLAVITTAAAPGPASYRPVEPPSTTELGDARPSAHTVTRPSRSSSPVGVRVEALEASQDARLHRLVYRFFDGQDSDASSESSSSSSSSSTIATSELPSVAGWLGHSRTPPVLSWSPHQAPIFSALPASAVLPPVAVATAASATRALDASYPLVHMHHFDGSQLTTTSMDAASVTPSSAIPPSWRVLPLWSTARSDGADAVPTASAALLAREEHLHRHQLRRCLSALAQRVRLVRAALSWLQSAVTSPDFRTELMMRRDWAFIFLRLTKFVGVTMTHLSTRSVKTTTGTGTMSALWMAHLPTPLTGACPDEATSACRAYCHFDAIATELLVAGLDVLWCLASLPAQLDASPENSVSQRTQTAEDDDAVEAAAVEATSDEAALAAAAGVTMTATTTYYPTGDSSEPSSRTASIGGAAHMWTRSASQRTPARVALSSVHYEMHASSPHDLPSPRTQPTRVAHRGDGAAGGSRTTAGLARAGAGEETSVRRRRAPRHRSPRVATGVTDTTDRRGLPRFTRRTDRGDREERQHTMHMVETFLLSALRRELDTTQVEAFRLWWQQPVRQDDPPHARASGSWPPLSASVRATVARQLDDIIHDLKQDDVESSTP